MVRLRDAVMAVALATGGVGCATFCDECDDFPVPGGPGGYSLMPGTYTGPPLQPAIGGGTARAATPGQGSTPAPTQGATPPPGGAPGTVPTPAGEAAPTPPPAPPAGAAGDRGASNASDSPGPALALTTGRTTAGMAEPAAAASPGDGLPAPAAGADSLPPLP